MKKITSVLLFFAILMQIGIVSVFAQKKNADTVVSLTNAYDAFGAQRDGLKYDFGFSCVVRYHGKNILFDAGTNTDVFEQNIKALKIDLRKIDIAILSHGHYDHMGGFDHLIKMNPNVKIYLPYDFFSLGAPTKFPFREPELAKNLTKDEQYFRGETTLDTMVTTPTGRFGKADVEYITTAKEVLPGVTLIPTRSELMGNFIKYPPFDKNPQFIGLPEISASFATDKGQVIIAGCSHSTIETIIKETKKVRSEKILMVAGGFHLIPYSRDYIEGLAKRMKNDYGVESVAAAHCTGQLGFQILRQVFGDGYKFFGLGETIKIEG
jgi:7,8-dihydropterin-6-yl-methyl-4-(beta-D-ribofuranosyl)aminobenzene 5'-phosphate synthase